MHTGVGLRKTNDSRKATQKCRGEGCSLEPHTSVKQPEQLGICSHVLYGLRREKNRTSVVAPEYTPVRTFSSLTLPDLQEAVHVERDPDRNTCVENLFAVEQGVSIDEAPRTSRPHRRAALWM
jgi:hypothetical protein